MQSEPMVTILLPVYNGSKYLAEAIESMLAQTFADFEFLIINDGSTDNTGEIISSHADNRIRLITHTQNQGLVTALNHGLAEARGTYIARMDADDISAPDRLEKQFAYMEQHPEIAALGTGIATFGRENHQEWRPLLPDEVHCHLLFHSTLAHPSVMLRRSVLERFSLYYDDAYKHAEDYKLWVQLSRHAQLANVPEVLLYYRVHDEQISLQKNQEQKATASLIQLEQLRSMGFEPTIDEFRIHYLLSQGSLTPNPDFVTVAAAWLVKLRTANTISGYFPEPAFTGLLGWYWKALWR